MVSCKQRSKRDFFPRKLSITVLSLSLSLTGCFGARGSLSFFGDRDLTYYKEIESQIDYPEIETWENEAVSLSGAPRTVRDPSKDEILDLSLKEAIHTALANNRIIRTAGSFRAPGNALLSNGDRNPSVYDVGIQSSGVLFGGRGVEAALADFDTRFAASMIWGRDETIQNNLFFGGGLNPGSTLQSDTAAFQSSLSKSFADSGSLTLAHDINYSGRNVPGQLFNSVYTGNIRAEYRRPLLSGSGTEFTRIAGASNPNFSSITGVSQGVVIARINNDISIADFEASVRNLVKDVEDTYWDLYLQYRLYHAAVVARESALRTWRDSKNKDDVGLGAKEDEPQSREFYYQSKAAAEVALNNIYSAEIRMRRLLGLPVQDGKMIRPSDEPIATEIVPDWKSSLTEALTERLELRKQKWNIKSLELQLKAAKSLTKPRLDFISRYQVNGFGDQLLGGDNDNDSQNTPQGLRSFYGQFAQGDQTNWSLGFQLNVPIGFRSARAQVRNYELRVAKAREVLATQELEIAHELAVTIQDLAAQHATSKSNLERRRAALKREQVLEPKSGVIDPRDLLLRAQQAVADAETAYYNSLIGYNKAITDFYFRKGTLLKQYNIYLAEGAWDEDAYKDAYRRAWSRSYGFGNSALRTQPREFVLPGYDESEEPLELEKDIPEPPMTEIDIAPSKPIDSAKPKPPSVLVPPPSPGVASRSKTDFLPRNDTKENGLQKGSMKKQTEGVYFPKDERPIRNR